MPLIEFIRDLQKIPEGIPAPGAIIYNASVSRLLKKPQKKLAQIITEQIKNGTIVDVGSGTGYLAIEIAKAEPRSNVCGIDVSKKMVEIARRNAEGLANVRFEHGNATDLPFADNSVDFIVSTGSLHHWKRPVKIFDECFRVLKEGKEGWIFDGWSDFPKNQANSLISEYGFLPYKVLSIALKFHGFSREEYRTKIKSVLDQTKFKNSYKMEQNDMWMKITVKK
ncbi:MAG: methyltransferase domain-containing protein [Methanocellales archaeon]|nr:methyltransferase domain-containing protein [Methanocellales archaeon]MDD3291029.1 methyltransferase domain-containing protein [Methanocellales archaeon]MDD5234914.1 methyltransferase domain-containing protein [Methanocellales archaeon]MDD5484716.1 methyltransferase domain-containing protein [Methanocellales archaeon]